jgi:hypothetical protein
MYIFKMSPQVPALSECFLTEGALKGSHSSMFSEMIPQITAFLEDRATTIVLALKVEFDSLCLRILDSYCLMPRLRNALKGLMLTPL